MRLFEVLSGVEYDAFDVEDRDIRGISIDSRQINSGDIFIAMRGEKHDGNDYIDEAIQNGASVIITEKRIEGIPCVVTPNVRQAYSMMCSNFFHNPSRGLKIIAVVGTNGKSTSAHIIYEILRYNGIKVGLIGTGRVIYGDKYIRQPMTTPDPYDLHGYFRDMVDEGIQYVVMEVSAHAIYLDKMYGIKCELGLFTNFSQDHLDFFKSMDIYKMVKMSYFNSRYLKVGIVNSDDSVGREILSNCDMPTFTYGLDTPSDVFAIDIEYCVDKTRFVVNMLDEISHFATNLIGKYNVYNILGGALVCRLIGVPMYAVRDAIASLKPLEGRYNIIKTSRADVIIDYAHTPSAFENVIKETRRIREGKLYIVFGAGGDRDKSKRPLMGEIATTYADMVVLTSDNSRSERTRDIIDDIISGRRYDNITILEDRYEAIKFAYEMSDRGDTILVLGKGSEIYQDNGDGKIYYSDEEAILEIANLRK